MVLGIDLGHIFIQLLQKISLAAHLGRESQVSLIVFKSTHVMHIFQIWNVEENGLRNGD